MSTARICDTAHQEGLALASFNISTYLRGEQGAIPYGRDFCNEHFQEEMTHYLSGGLKDDIVVTFCRI